MISIQNLARTLHLRRSIHRWGGVRVGLVAASVVLGMVAISVIASSHRTIPTGPAAKRPSPIASVLSAVDDPEKEEALLAARIAEASRLEIEVFTHGLEHQSAGFHLLRPAHDKYWRGGSYGPLMGSGGFEWWQSLAHDPAMRYYELSDDASLHAELGYANISQSRLFGNTVGRASCVANTNGTWRVEFVFSRRGLSTISARMAPSELYTDGTYLDWFWEVREPEEKPTPMVFLAVMDNRLFAPISADALLLEGPGPTVRVLADNLDNSTASELASALNQP